MNNNKLTVDLFIEYSSEIARSTRYPPALLYGWGIFSIKQIDETVTRAKKNRITFEESAWVQVAKITSLKAITIGAPAWKTTSIAQRLGKSAVHTVKDYGFSGIFEQGYAVSRSKTDNNGADNLGNSEKTPTNVGTSTCGSSSSKNFSCETLENPRANRWRVVSVSVFDGEYTQLAGECEAFSDGIEGAVQNISHGIFSAYAEDSTSCSMSFKNILNDANAVFGYTCKHPSVEFSGTYELFLSKSLLRTIRTQLHKNGDIIEEARYEPCDRL